MVNLTELVLGDNKISDFSPLSGRRDMWGLSLNDNPILDWSPVARLSWVSGRP